MNNTDTRCIICLQYHSSYFLKQHGRVASPASKRTINNQDIFHLYSVAETITNIKCYFNLDQNNCVDFHDQTLYHNDMEIFTVLIKGIASEKPRSIKIKAMDHYHAHYKGCGKYSELKEDIISIKDSRGSEVYNLDKGFLFTDE